MYISVLARLTSRGGAGWRGPAAAVGLTGAAAALRALLEPLAADVAPFATFYVSTLLAALFGGAWSGALATLLGGAVAAWLFIAPEVPADTLAANLGMFFLTQAAVVTAAAILRAALARAAAAERALQAKVAELQALMDLAPVGIWFARAPEVREVVRNRFAQELMRAEPGSGAPLVPPPGAAAGGVGRAPRVELRRDGRVVPEEALPLRRALRGEESRDEEYEFAFPDGSAITLLSNARPIRDARGAITGAVSASLDITALKRTEAALREAVAERELLQREADHRIKNSLQLVAGVLRLQRNRVRDEAAAALLDEAGARVTAVAEAHSALQQSRDLRSADVGRMVESLCRSIGRLNPDVTVSCTRRGETMLEVERAIPLGLVVSELLTNAVRHAYPPGVAGQVQLRVEEAGEALEVEVRDDGVGMAEAEAGGRPGSLGRELVRTLSARIGATVGIRSAPGEGTTVRLVVPRAPAESEPGEESATSDGALAPG